MAEKEFGKVVINKGTTELTALRLLPNRKVVQPNHCFP
jgi:hypothetical protein